MKNTIKRGILVSYRWWRDNDEPIKPEHEEALDESARAHIFNSMCEGFTSGELSDNIHMTKDDPKDGVEYKGWWETSNKDS